MPYEIPSFGETRDLLIAAMSGRFPNANLSRFSDNYKRMSVVALGISDVHLHVRQVGLDVMPDTAEGDQLLRHGVIWGVTAKGASGSTGAASLRVFGAVASPVPVDEPLTHTPSGLRFKTASGGSIPAGGFLDVNIAAIDTGEQTNLDAGDELQFETTPAGLEDITRITIDLTNGQDKEKEGFHRDRLLNRIGQPAAGGNRNDFENFVLESAAFVDAAYVYPNRNGGGTVDLAALKEGRGAARLLDLSERNTVLALVNAVRPVTATVRVLEVTTSSENVDVKVLPENDPQYSFDWNDATPLVMLTYVSGTRTLTFTTTRPADLGVGDRLVVAGATATGEVSVVESLSGASAVVLADDLSFTPAASAPVHAGGPLTEPTRNAIFALFDALGPANPSQKYGPWESAIRLSKLFEAAQLTAGVLDSEIVTPVATVDSEDFVFPANDKVELLIPGQILVRRKF